MPSKKRISAWILSCFLIFFAFSANAQSVHTVVKGDSVSRIASRYLPFTAAYTKQELVRDIMELNGMPSQNLKIGQKLVIPVVRKEPLRPKVVKKPRDFVAKGVYINQWTAGSRQVFLVADRLKSYGANTIVFDAKDVRGGLSYSSPVPGSFTPVSSYPHGIEDMSKLIAYLHLMDIHVVARVCVFRDMLVAGLMHHWRIDKDWLNPADPEVQDYLLAIIKELAGLGVDEIQLDYIRYPAEGKEAGGAAERLRSDVITDFLARIHQVTSKNGVLLSLDMFGIVIWQKREDIESVGQDIVKMKPYVDVISPMLYPSHFSDDFAGVKNPADEPYLFVSSGIQRLKSIVGDDLPIRPWLQAFPLRVTKGYGPGFIQTQINAAGNNGAVGWLLWSPGNYYSDSYAAMENLLEVTQGK